MDIYGITIDGKYINVTPKQRLDLIRSRVPFQQTDFSPSLVTQQDPFLRETRAHFYFPTFEGDAWLRFFFAAALPK